MAQVYFDMITTELESKIMGEPPYLQACKAQNAEWIEHNAKIESLEMEVEEMKMEIAKERERTRQQKLFRAFNAEIRKQVKNENASKQSFLDSKKRLFKSPTDQTSGGGRDSLRRY